MALAFEYGVAQTVAIVCYDGETPTAPTNPVVTVSIDGAAFGAADNAPSVVGPVVFYELSIAEMTAGVAVVKVASDDLEDHYREVYPSGVYTSTRGLLLDNLDQSLSTTETNIRGADDDDLKTLSDQIDNLPSPGTGARTVTFTLSDGAGTLAGSLETHVEDADGNTLAGPLTTNKNGLVTYYLDDATVYLVTPSTVTWQGNSEEVTIDATAESDGVDVTLTAQTLPTPSSPDKYTIIINATDEHDALVGASARSYKITSIYPTHDPSANLVRSTERNAITTDANGQASFEVGQNVTGGTLLETYTDEDSVERTVERRFVVDSDEADESDRIYFADIEVE
jgi:hypothetical protein